MERIHATINNKSLKYLDELKEKRDCRSRSEALDLIIREHQKNLNLSIEDQVNLMAEIISEKTASAMYKIAKGVNKNDRNIQILIELINGLFINENQMDIMSTEERMHEAYQTAQKTVNDRIEKQALKKHYRTYD
ncbi:hypothetical protein ACRTAK_002976 [Clostridium perfringens]|uniref:hypothetical protein n=1 Tax=Clostridium perfringens TaxID=1502 RepID=UPI002865AB1B|nr:hypothetical protein [Clostridium perfringens]ELC8454600.1 hypothetical protein [Clostridium perfringens]MDK0553533.1 hypothetical protein [Clostridium perfringens]MDT7932591.1 hypothetical protein [Clostridium perfringens]MDT7956668.1 hypothetical protein [Clostridium perfringens]